MPRPRKIPLPPADTAKVAAALRPCTRVLLCGGDGDDRDTALEVAERLANERAAALEAAGAHIVSISTQALCVERYTRWQVAVTIVYREQL